MKITRKQAELSKDKEDYFHLKGFGKIHVESFTIETDDYLSKKVETIDPSKQKALELIEIYKPLFEGLPPDLQMIKSKEAAIKCVDQITEHEYKSLYSIEVESLYWDKVKEHINKM